MNASREMVVKLLEAQSDGSLALMVRTYRWEQPSYVGKSGPPLVNEAKVPVRPAYDDEEAEVYIDPRSLQLVRVAPV